MNKIDLGLECTPKNCNIENLDHPYIPDETLLKNTLSNTLNDIERYKGNVLFVVNCTRKKVFPNIKRHKNNKRDNCDRGYTPAGCAYCGSSFIRFKIFLEELKKKMKEKDIDYPIYWIILSAKYGFIEPDHPIHDYNVAFNYEDTGPISMLSLIRQAIHQTRRWKITHGINDYTYITKKLIEFDRIYVYTRNVYYLLALTIIFGAKAKRIILTKDDKQLENPNNMERLKRFIQEIADALKFN